MDGVIGDRRVGHTNSIWTISNPDPDPDLCIPKLGGQVGVIGFNADALCVYYHIETGEVLDPIQAP